ncbi:MAG TPA: hypothetical protein VJ957_01140 [Longimicrobiales bacterium]|nr:hypothetical protein [Longimicrobiales bacterium]
MRGSNLRRTDAVVLLGAAALLGAGALAGCGNSMGPNTWLAIPDTATLYSLSRTDYVGKPSAYDFTPGTNGPVVVEAPGYTNRWDIAIVAGANGLELAPAGTFEGVSATPALTRITTAGDTFDNLATAPSDSKLYTDSTRLPAVEGGLYVVRTRQVSTCVYYAKFEVLSIDQQAGTVRLVAMGDPYCNDRDLISPGS